MRITIRTAMIGALLLVTSLVGAVALQQKAYAQVVSGVFASTPVFNSGGLAFAVFGGGSVTQLEAAAQGANASGVWAQDSTGKDVLLVVNGPAFLKEPFSAAFSAGFTGPRAVTLVRASGAPTPAPTSTPVPTATPTPVASTLGRAVAEIVVQQTNQQRTMRGLGALTTDAKLTAAAEAYAQVVFTADPYFGNVAAAHTHDGQLADRVNRVGYLWGGLAENVHWIAPALGATPVASTLATGTVTGWMDSPPHRANMLAPEYTQTGVGCATGQPASPRAANPIVVICVGIYALPR